MLNRRHWLGGMAASLCVNARAQEPHPKPIVLAMIRSEEQFLGRWQRLIYRDAFARLGRDVVFVDYPAARASVELDRGAVDGEGGRPLSYVDSSPNMVRLKVPLFEVNYVAFARRADLKPLTGWESLRGFTGVVAYKTGVYTTTTNLPKVLPASQLIGLPETERGLKMLGLGRSDLYIDEEMTILTALTSPELADLPLVRAGILAVVGVYCYLHQRHAELAVKLGDVIAQMQKQGDIERYRRRTEKVFSVNPAKWIDQ